MIAADLIPEARALVAAVYRAAGREPPALDEGRLRAALEKHLHGEETHEMHRTALRAGSNEETPDRSRRRAGTRGVSLRGAHETGRWRDTADTQPSGLVAVHSVAARQAPASAEIALAGPDGREAARLLRRAKLTGIAVLHTLAESALARLLQGDWRRARRLFSDGERQALARALAAANGTAELLGRARVRLRQEQAEQRWQAERFAEDDPADFSRFDEGDTAGLHPLAPQSAVAYFRRLVPTLTVDADAFDREQRERAFTLAASTDLELTGRVKDVLRRVLETGEGVGEAPQLVRRVLDEAGVTVRNPQYAEMVTRTNLMHAFTEGTTQEMQHPDVKAAFPVWRYLGIRDGRQGKDHEPRFDRYYRNGVTFDQVRGARVFNCRCGQQPVYRRDWERLQEAGARVTEV